MMLEYANKNICGVHLYRLKNIGSNLKCLKNRRQPDCTKSSMPEIQANAKQNHIMETGNMKLY